MIQMHRPRLSPEEVRFERAKAERANFIVSEAIGDPQFMKQALDGIEPCDRGISMLWPEFLLWESRRRGESAEPAKNVVAGLRFEPRVSPRVRDLVASLTNAERALFEQSLIGLCTNPFIDNVTKFSLPYPPVVLFLYQDGPFRIIYRIVSGAVIDLLNLSWAPDVPSIAEWDAWRKA